MLKLLKYELENHLLPLAIASVCFVAGVMLQSGALMLFSFIGLVVLQILLITQTFGSNLFGKRGALLLLLPLSLDSLLLAKITSCLLQIFGSFGVVFSSLYFFDPMGQGSLLLTQESLLSAGYFFTFVLSCILQIFFTLTLLHLFGITKMRLTMGLFIFLLLSILSGHVNPEIWGHLFALDEKLAFPSAQWDILRYVVDSVVFYFLGRTIILKKLSL